MKSKQLLTVGLLIFIAVSIAYMIVREQATATSTTHGPGKAVSDAEETPGAENASIGAGENIQNTLAANETENAKQRRQLIVYYFHGDVRCPTCHKLENYAKEALTKYFPDKLASEDFVWKPVNVDRPQTSHYVRDYQLVTKSVVLSEMTDGRQCKWKNLDEIWERVTDKDSYLKYIRQSILEFLEEAQP